MLRVLRRCLGAMLIAAAPALSAAEPPAPRPVDDAALHALIDRGAKVVDVRTPEEWRQTGVIVGATLITAFDRFGRFDPGFPQALEAAVRRDEDLVVICWQGNRSAVVARVLAERTGYARVHDATGGMKAWLSAGRPVEPCRTC